MHAQRAQLGARTNAGVKAHDLHLPMHDAPRRFAVSFSGAPRPGNESVRVLRRRRVAVA
jgi:hypothetical protein